MEKPWLFKKGQTAWNKGMKGHMSPEGIQRMVSVHIGVSPANRKFFIKKEELEDLYWREEKSLSEIAKILGLCNGAAVAQWMVKYGIPRRPQGFMTERIVKQVTEKRLKTFHNHPEIKLKLIKSVQAMLKRRPTIPEQKLSKVIKANDLPYKYTGDGTFWVGSFNPDFVNCNGKKIAVEVFSDYWHNPLLRANIPYYSTYRGRQAVFARYGWEVRILWENEVLSLPDEAIIRRLM